MKKNTVRIAWFGVFTALALIFSYVETLIPFQIGIPGVKLGLANLIVVVALYKMGGKDAMLLSVTRIVLSGFIFASLFSILYSLAGGLLSLAVMVILKKRGSCGLESQNGETDRSRFDLWFFLLGQHCLDGAPAKEETEQQRHADGGLMADGAHGKGGYNHQHEGNHGDCQVGTDVFRGRFLLKI